MLLLMLVKKEKLRKGVEDAMGGNILELESERQRKIGKIDVYYRDFNYSVDEIAEKLHISREEVEDIINSLPEEKEETL